MSGMRTMVVVGSLLPFTKLADNGAHSYLKQ